MGILSYQVLIVVTLAMTRMLAPSKFLTAAIIWTGLTIFNLAWPPLIFLQLAVIWGSWILLRPKSKKAIGPIARTNSAARPSAERSSSSTAQSRTIQSRLFFSEAESAAQIFPRLTELTRRSAPVFDIPKSSVLAANTWQPSFWGKVFSRSDEWTLQFVEGGVWVTMGANKRLLGATDVMRASLDEGVFWTSCVFSPSEAKAIKLAGLPNRRARELDQLLQGLSHEYRVQFVRRRANTLAGQLHTWLKDVHNELRPDSEERRWLTYERQKILLANRNQLTERAGELKSLLSELAKLGGPDVAPTRFNEILCLWHLDWPEFWARANEAFVQHELIQYQDLLNRVEKNPLSEEQSRAVVCFDNKVQVVASAGSGKTSTMVAKAAYAIQKKIAAPERVLLLAFNKSAADELQARATEAFERLGMKGTFVEARTFHSLGRSIIGKVSGKMPEVPDWAIDTGLGIRKLSQIVDSLKDQSVQFRTNWDMFRMIVGRDIPPIGGESRAEEWDRDGAGYLRTLRGDRVRSQEECIIANWLFYNGVNYEYERAYEFDTGTDERRQYRPDFYYPDIELYHEHLALNREGVPPPHFARYLEDLTWKRAEHKRRGTALVETTSHQLRTGELFAHLTAELVARGIELDPNPDRPIPSGGEPPIEDGEVLSLVRTFISHVKSNCLTPDSLRTRLTSLSHERFSFRHGLFLALFFPTLDAWDDALRAERGIDFEDMLNQAAEHIEQSRYEPPFEVVMADEFQDCSRARARLCRALVTAPNRYFFAVGDDWQSINRFAGADVALMTKFERWFGDSQQLKLEQTFRCPQVLCDVSSQFVTKNPAQLKKNVVSKSTAQGKVFRIVQVPKRDELKAAIVAHLDSLYAGLAEGAIAQGKNGRISVFILGRYKSDSEFVPQNWKYRYRGQIELTFSTMHSSKGAEADYVILPAMLHRGFPNLRTDDPILDLVLPEGDSFDLAEERRLFYVALTRARRSVAMFAVSGQSSKFLDELVVEHSLTVESPDGTPIEECRCPVCKTGLIVVKEGQYGAFHTCTNFPKCEYRPPKVAQKGGGSQRSVRPFPRNAKAKSESKPTEISTAAGYSTDVRSLAKVDSLARSLWDFREGHARRTKVPSYVVFHDRTLRELVLRRPSSMDELRGISGLGQAKINRYGNELLAVIAKHKGAERR